jgi:hypothetical protein
MIKENWVEKDTKQHALKNNILYTVQHCIHVRTNETKHTLGSNTVPTTTSIHMTNNYYRTGAMVFSDQNSV